MLLKLKEVNFRYPVKLESGPNKNIWNDVAFPRTQVWLDFGGAIPKLLLTPRGSNEVIRIIPYHALGDCSAYDELTLPEDE
jgi:hypothetical protein